MFKEYTAYKIHGNDGLTGKEYEDHHQYKTEQEAKKHCKDKEWVQSHEYAIDIIMSKAMFG